MKTFIKACMLLLLLVINYNSKAQSTALRPKLFNGVENKISYPKAELAKVFTNLKEANIKSLFRAISNLQALLFHLYNDTII